MFKSREKHINIRFVSTCGLQLRKFIYFFRRWLAQWKRVHFFHFIKPLPYIALHVILSIILARCVSIYVPFKNHKITRVKEMMVMMTSLIHCSYTRTFFFFFLLFFIFLTSFPLFVLSRFKFECKITHRASTSDMSEYFFETVQCCRVWRNERFQVTRSTRIHACEKFETGFSTSFYNLFFSKTLFRFHRMHVGLLNCVLLKNERNFTIQFQMFNIHARSLYELSEIRELEIACWANINICAWCIAWWCRWNR